MLHANDKLGPYTIVGHLGSGGMGEVYRARDSRLGREVAIKVLPPDFASDADRMRRFEQEARAASTINHPNLLAIYDIGSNGDGSPYMVSELLQGETLRERLQAGQIATRKALDIGLAIAQGMAAAHERGIVHRDLKPENIFLTTDGHVKILDFGLAKLTAPPSADAEETVNYSTQRGVSLGTPGYMSPEQVRGQAVDARSDVFSFGAVLFEMLTGDRAFKGSTMADISSAILREEPPWPVMSSKLVPAELERIVQHCLEKSPGARFQSARDLAFQLQGISTPSSATSGAASSASVSHLSGTKKFAALLLLLGLAAVTIWVVQRAIGGREPATVPEVRYERLTDFAGLEESPAISPDGRSVAFTADVSGTKQLWVRLLGGGPPLQITKDSGVHLEPRWSPDSSSIYYFVPPGESEEQGTIWQVPALGGRARRLTSGLTAADVSRGGRLTYFRLNQKKAELVVAEADGTNESSVLQRDLDHSYQHPRWSPDDRTIAYQQSDDFWTMDIYAVPAAGGQPRRVTYLQELISGLSWTPDSSSIVFSASGRATLLYLPTMQLWQVAVSGGDPHRLTFGDISYEMPDISKEGRLLASGRRMQFDIWKFPVSGDPRSNVAHAARITHQTAKVLTPSLSPDDRQMVYLSDSGGHGDLWVMDLKSGESSEITSMKADSTVGIPLWSPDGKMIAFAVTSGTGSWRDVDYYLVNPDGSSQRKVITHGSWASWSPDSKWLYYTNVSPIGPVNNPGGYKISIEGGQPILIRKERATGIAPAPDGSGIYFVRPLRGNNGAQSYLLCIARPESGEAQTLLHMSNTQVPTWQGPHPSVSPDGKSLAILLNDDLGTNIWLASTKDGSLKRVTDFGDRRTYIARRVSWTSDGRYIFAAVGEGDSDIVALTGLLH